MRVFLGVSALGVIGGVVVVIAILAAITFGIFALSVLTTVFG